MFYDPDGAFILAQKHHDFAEERKLEKYQGQALRNQGVGFAVVGNDDSALVYYEKVLFVLKNKMVLKDSKKK